MIVTIIAIIIVLVIIILLVVYRKENGFYLTSEVYPDLVPLTYPNNLEIIKSELNTIQEQHWTEWPETQLWKKGSARWTVFPLLGFDKWSDNTQKCPETTKLLKAIPGLKTAGFSRMAPGTNLEIHRGWADLSNNVLRSHMLLTENPPGTSNVWVNGKTHPHIFDNWITFDDSLPHSASNQDTKDRIILLVDIERPSYIPKGTSTVKTSSELNSFINAM